MPSGDVGRQPRKSIDRERLEGPASHVPVGPDEVAVKPNAKQNLVLGTFVAAMIALFGIGLWVRLPRQEVSAGLFVLLALQGVTGVSMGCFDRWYLGFGDAARRRAVVLLARRLRRADR
jgi:hypothetical protein